MRRDGFLQTPGPLRDFHTKAFGSRDLQEHFHGRETDPAGFPPPIPYIPALFLQTPSGDMNDVLDHPYCWGVLNLEMKVSAFENTNPNPTPAAFLRLHTPAHEMELTLTQSGENDC
uniref:Uncharacterized protein n=1 Tax=Sphaerodactylus townsendi TaxID=933632 RepID=A0ACB8E831_9SAUR